MGFAPSWPKQVIFFPFFLTVVNYTKHFSSLPLLSMWFSGVNVAQQCEYLSPERFSSCKTKTRYSLNNSPFSPHPPPGNNHSFYFMFLLFLIHAFSS